MNKMLCLLEPGESVLSVTEIEIVNIQAIKRFGKEGERGLVTEMTELCDVMVNNGHFGVYEETFESIEKKVVKWEYRWEEGGEVHGPFSSGQMKGWKEGGFFEDGKIQVRRVGEGEFRLIKSIEF